MQHLTWYDSAILFGLLLSSLYFFIKNRPYQTLHLIIFGLLLMIAGLEVFAVNLARRGINNNLYYNIVFVYLETLILLYFFAKTFEEKTVSYILLLSGIIFLGWGLVNSLYFQSILFFQTYSFIPGSLLVIGCCIYFFNGITRRDWYIDKNLLSLPIFWIISLILFFYSCSFIYFSSMRMIYEMDRELMRQIGFLNRIISATMYVVMGFAFYAPFIFKNEEQFISKDHMEKPY